MDEQRANILRGAFGANVTAATKAKTPPAPATSAPSPDLRSGLNPAQQAEYDKFIKKGMSPKQAAAFAKNVK